MYELMVEDNFNSAHFLKGYDGNCKNLHGHNFRVQIFVKGLELNQIGLLADYRLLKKELKVILSELDHKLLNDILKFNPTSELLAKYLYNKLKAVLKHISKKVRLSKVIIWESDKTSASYFEE
ncbi:6-carboxytetrahydropterin synthase QueD [Candidatus Margulisiibacteriota bacterium]